MEGAAAQAETNNIPGRVPPALGHSVPRVDAPSKVRGEALYPGDINLPNMLHMKTLFAGRPHARIKRIDTHAAEVHAGVVAVFTDRDVPVNEYGLIRADQPVLCGTAQPGADVVRYVGDRVALVVAESEPAAAAARDRIEVEYEDLEVVTDPRVSMRAPGGAPLLFPGRPSNVLLRQPIRRGDIAAGFAEADVIVEDEYQTWFQEHAYLQPEAGVAYVDDQGRVTVQVAGQWAHDERRQIAHALGLPEEAVRVNEIVNSTKLFRQPSAEPAKAVLDRVVELFGVYGTEAIVALGAKALPPDLRAPAFAIAVDLVLADGEASIEERKFIDGLQDLLQVPDEDAVKIADVIIIKNSV